MKIIGRLVMFAVATALVVLVFTIFPPLMRDRRSLRAQRDALRAENARLEAQVAELRRMQEAFRTNPEYVEIVARREGLARADETVFDFSQATPEPARSGDHAK